MKLLREDWEMISSTMFSRLSIGCVSYAGETLAAGLRRILLHRFPFSLVYSIEADLILVIAIAHHGRRPGYWQSRVDR